MSQPQEQVKFSDLAKFQPKQLEAKNAVKNFKYVFYGGAAGGGKSYWLRWMALWLTIYYATKYNVPGVRIGLFCEDYPALKERQLSKIEFEFPAWLGTLNKSEHEFKLAKAYGGGVICFRNLDDPSKYLSSEFAAILVDELTKNQRETFDYLNLRLRWPGITDSKFIGASNPGEVGHGWVKKLWITRDFEGERFDPTEFAFVQAKYSDNKYLPSNYEKQLDSLSLEMRKAYKDGDWDIFKGQYFSEWRAERHVIEPFAIPSGWRRIRCLDYGNLRPSAVYWLAIDYDGKVHVYRELYETGHTYQSLARKITQMSPGDEKIEYTVADTSIFAKSPDTGRDGDDIMAENGVAISPANKERVLGWNLMREYLREGRIVFFSTCLQAIRTIPSLVYATSGNPEDLDTNGDDHSADAIRYGLMSCPQKPSAGLPPVVQNPYLTDPDWQRGETGTGYKKFYSN